MDPNRLAHAHAHPDVEALIIGGAGRFEGASGMGGHDIFFVNDQGDFVINAETTFALQRRWNNEA